MATTDTGGAAPGGPAGAPQAAPDTNPTGDNLERMLIFAQAVGIDVSDAKTVKEVWDVFQALKSGNMDAKTLQKAMTLAGKAGKMQAVQNTIEFGLTEQAMLMSNLAMYEQAREEWEQLSAEEQTGILMNAVSVWGHAKEGFLTSALMMPYRQQTSLKRFVKSQAGKVFDSVQVGVNDFENHLVLKAALLGVFPCKPGVLEAVREADAKLKGTAGTGAGWATKAGTLLKQPEVALLGGAVGTSIALDSIKTDTILPKVRENVAKRMEASDAQHGFHDKEMGVLGKPIEAAEA